MTQFVAKAFPDAPDVLAPDGSEVRVLVSTGRGSMAHFRLAPAQVSMAVAHHSVEELWHIIAGQGRLWRKSGDSEDVTVLVPGLSLSILPKVAFQFRNDGDMPLDVIGVTMPPWPGVDEAYAVPGKW